MKEKEVEEAVEEGGEEGRLAARRGGCDANERAREGARLLKKDPETRDRIRSVSGVVEKSGSSFV